jgi:hypothetical protein
MVDYTRSSVIAAIAIAVSHAAINRIETTTDGSCNHDCYTVHFKPDLPPGCIKQRCFNTSSPLSNTLDYSDVGHAESHQHQGPSMMVRHQSCVQRMSFQHSCSGYISNLHNSVPGTTAGKKTSACSCWQKLTAHTFQ